MYYIYCFNNKLNNHKYIGYTNDLTRRFREHLSSAYNTKSGVYNYTFAKKIRQYGKESFEIIILEILDDHKKAIEREAYWIKHYNTYEGPGYNIAPGGIESTWKNKLSEEQVKEIYVLLRTDCSVNEIKQRFNISGTLVSNINRGYKYVIDPAVEFPIRHTYKEDDEYDDLIKLLTTTSLSFSRIAKELNISVSTVKKINYGSLRKGMSDTYPIRKKVK
jgi:group I intron endonuclease